MSDLLRCGPPVIRVNSGGDNTKFKSPAPLETSALKKRNRTNKRVTIQPVSRIVRDVGNVFLSWRDGLSESEREHQRRTEERMQILAARMQNVTTRKEWDTAATELDSLEGNDEWKLDSSTGDYNPYLIEAKLEELDAARTNCDIRSMLYLIRTALSRDLGGMGNLDLYRHSYVGSKKLIEQYVDSAVKTIESLVEKSAYALPSDIEPKDLLEGMLYARQSFGRSALLLSGGATFGMSHIGVLKALFEAQLLPRIISGASAGSIVCAVLCVRKDEEIPELISQFPYGDLGVFDSEYDSIADHIRRLLTEGSWSDITHLTRVMRGMLGDMTFQEAYNRTRRICNICVSSASIFELPRLLNYITSPNVMIWSAVAASCSVPLVFQAAPLLVKDPATGAHMPWNPTPQRWIDGSVDNDLPMTRLAEMFNVNHFIVSQVNPHVVPFLSKDDRLYPTTSPGRLRLRQQQQTQETSEWLYTLTSLAKDETMHRLHFLAELGIFPNLFTKLRCILNQRYSGDITILPEISIRDLPRILKNPTSDFMLRNCLVGEKATWPKLSRIRDRCAIELALDHAVHALRARVVFSKSQVDLRRMVASSEPQSVRPGTSRGPTDETDAVAGQQRPVCAVHQGSPGEASPEDEPHRRRRGSGGSIQLQMMAAKHRKMFQQHGDDGQADGPSEDDDDDERLEMRSGQQARRAPAEQAHSSNGRPAAPTKPKLVRAAKSQNALSRGKWVGWKDDVVSGDGEEGCVCGQPGGRGEFGRLVTSASPSGGASLSGGNQAGNDSGVVMDDSGVEGEGVRSASAAGAGAGARSSESSDAGRREAQAQMNVSDADVESDEDPYLRGEYRSASVSEEEGSERRMVLEKDYFV
ncbi:acyl transferase/acyl hydrolase/lysophospholipase [Cercophora scortea]|uniref:Patatin-like phospholipase domain-containing protein n=1 Tax=Cercophora scortea TaxID=314031 RepID=A0AAE0M6J2_9PEZI|nr:acyl transferase/acyl hydrolase/lysophospholipase [Cercophora scortea]